MSGRAVRRALGERPYIYAGGRKWKERFSGRETRPLREDGRLGEFAGGSCGYGRFYCDNPSVCPFGQTPPFTQGRLLRALDERPYMRAGGAAGEWVDGKEFVRREAGARGKTGDHAVF